MTTASEALEATRQVDFHTAEQTLRQELVRSVVLGIGRAVTQESKGFGVSRYEDIVINLRNRGVVLYRNASLLNHIVPCFGIVVTSEEVEDAISLKVGVRWGTELLSDLPRVSLEGLNDGCADSHLLEGSLVIVDDVPLEDVGGMPVERQGWTVEKDASTVSVLMIPLDVGDQGIEIENNFREFVRLMADRPGVAEDL